MEEKDNKTFDSSVFTDYLRSKLISLFDTVQGQKLLIADTDVISLLTMLLGKQQLEENGIKKVQTLDTVSQIGLDKEFVHVVFFIQPNVSIIDQISEIIKVDQKEKSKNKKKKVETEYIIIYWPQRTILCDEALERLGIRGCVEIKDFNFDLVPMDEDILSYEMSNSFNDLYINNDLNIYKYVAESIQKIQTVYGKIPNIFAKGDGSKVVLDILQQEIDISKEINGSQQPEIETLIMFDRTIDLLTPQLYPMTYEGQLDEKFGIEGNIIAVENTILKQDPRAQGKAGMKLLGQNSDIYKDIRNSHINGVISKLQQKNNELKQTNEEFQILKRENASIEEMNKLTQKIKSQKQTKPDLEIHFPLIQHIMEVINTTQCIQFQKEQELQTAAILMSPDYNYKNIVEYCDMQCAIGKPIENVLRLLMLVSQIENGIKAKEYDKIRRSLITAYGFNKITTLDNLANCGLFQKNHAGKGNYEKIKEKFKLINPEVNITEQDDVSYVFGGYAPLTARLAETIITKQSWKDYKEYINLVPGQTHQPQRSYVKTQKDKPCIMIFMIGGITYPEISAFRYLGRKYGKEIIIATTQILNSKKLYKQIYNGQLSNTVISKTEAFTELVVDKKKKK